MSDSIFVSVGNRPTMLTPWSHGRSGVFGELYERANRAANIVSTFARKREQIRKDPRLSAQAQKADERAAGEEALKALAVSQGLLNGIAERLAEEQTEIIAVEPYKPGDVATVMIDLALAAHIKNLDSAAVISLVRQGTDERLVEAIVRLPIALTGVTEEMRQRAITNAIYRKDPAKAQIDEAQAESISQARFAHKQALKLLSAEGVVAPLMTREERAAQITKRLRDAGALDDEEPSAEHDPADVPAMESAA